jgi:hypothetical protein
MNTTERADTATPKQIGMLNGISHNSALQNVVSAITFGTKPKITKHEASRLIELIQANRLESALAFANVINSYNAWIFYHEQYIKLTSEGK